MKKLSTKNRGVRALIVTGIAGASIVASGIGGSMAESRPLQTYYPCYNDVDKVARIIIIDDCTPDTRPEPTTSTTEATTTTAVVTTTTEVPVETTTTMVGQTTTTMAPGSTTTTAPGGVAGAGGGAAPARPIAAQASYAG